MDTKNLTIKVGKYTMTLNPAFLHANNATDKVELIKSLFVIKFTHFGELDATDDVKELRAIEEKIIENEYLIQEAFGFPRSIDHFRFWELPKCTCPVIDNIENWGTKYHYHSGNCPLHGFDK